MAATEDFQEKTKAFLAWLHNQPGTNVNPKIRIIDLREQGAGRGIFAVEDIDQDEQLFSLANSDVLTTETSSLNQTLPGLLDHLDPWNSLVLVLIYEHGQAEKSRWWHYLNILPTQVDAQFDTLIYWSPSELAELHGSAVVDKIGKDAADLNFVKTLLPIVHNHAPVFGSYAHIFGGTKAKSTLLEVAHRMATLIMAYAFDLNPDHLHDTDEDEEDGSSQTAHEFCKGMVPLADTLNADGDLNNAHLVQVVNDDSMSMIAINDIKEGQQIYNDFGHLPRSDLLRRYGFVTDRYKQWDVVEVPIEIVVRVVAEHNPLTKSEKKQRLQLAADWEVLQDGFDLTRPSKDGKFGFEFEHDLLLTATALLLKQKDFEHAVASLADIDVDPFENPPQSMNTTLGLVLKEIVLQRQGGFSTTIAEDIALLTKTNLQRRHRMAIEVRLGEKEILALASEEIDKRIAEIGEPRREDANDTQAKKRKL